MDATVASLIGASIGALAVLLGAATNIIGTIIVQNYQRKVEIKK